MNADRAGALSTAGGAPGVVSSRSVGIATIVLDRASRGNAMSAPMVEALIEAIEDAIGDPAVHTIVLGATGRHFCTGFDLSGLEDESDASLLARFVRVEMLLDLVWRAPVRTVAVGHGRIMGAGADLFAACDLRFLAPGSTLRFPGAGFGIVLGTRRLAGRVGDATALDWVGTGATVDAQASLASGLASRLLDDGGGAEPGDPGRAALAAALGTLEGPVAGATLAVDRSTYAALKSAVRDREADADLAALVRSAARPGLKARIESYRDRQLPAPKS